MPIKQAKKQKGYVLVYRRNGLGDFLSATVPMCELYKAHTHHDNDYPQKMIYCVSRLNERIVRLYDPTAEIIRFDRWCKNKYLNAIITVLTLWSRHGRPTIALAGLPGLGKMDRFFLWLLNARCTLTFNQKSKFVGQLFSKTREKDKIIEEDLSQHIALNNLRLLDSSLTEIPQSTYPKLLKGSKPPTNHKPALYLSFINNRKSCTLTYAKTREILEELINKGGTFSLIVSLPDDSNEAREHFLEACPKDIDVTFLKTPTLESFIKSLTQIDCFLLGDGGAAHIAGSLNKPGVTLFGKTPVERWGVLGNNIINIFHGHDINEIDTNDIVKALMNVLSIHPETNQ